MGNANSFLLQQSSQREHRNAKPIKDKPDLKEPAFEGYVAGWRQGAFDNDDAQEFHFATFQQHHHQSHNSSGYEGDDEEDEQRVQTQERVRREEFTELDRGRGLGRSGSLRGKAAFGGGVECPESLERKLERVRQTVADEHALPRGLGMGTDGKEVRVR